MSDKPLFDFTKKYTKRSIAEFLLKHGVDKETYQYRSLDTPEQIEYEVLYLCKSKLPELEKKAKLYNASVIFGGEGNFSDWRIDLSAQGAYNKLAEWLHHVENPYGVILWEQWESTQNVYRNTAKTLLPHMKESFFEEKKPILKVSECGHIHPYCSHDSPVEFLSKKECEHEWETDYTVESPDQIKCSKCGEVTTV